MSERIAAVEDFLTCPVCLDTFKEPVSLGCNHSFCSSCLQNYWDTNNTKNCPVCRKEFKDFPPVNFALKQLSLNFKAEEGVCSKHPQTEAEEGVCSKHPQTEAEEGVCSKHPQTEAEQGVCSKHPQTEAEEGVCSKHPSVPALFCLDEARALCSTCEFSQHRDHTVVSVEEAVSRLKEQLQSELKPLTEQREQASALQRQYEEVRVHSERQAEACARHIRETFERLHRFLQEEEELRLTALREERSRQLHTMDSELEKVRELLSTLNKNISTVEQQLKREHMDFIRQYSHSQKSSRSLLSQPTLRLGPGLLINQATVLGNMGFKAWEKMRSQVHDRPVILDPNTANPWLYLSEDLSGVRRGETEQQVPDNPERFSKYSNVLGSEGWSCGSHQWDVEVGDHPGWVIGVAKESVDRKGKRSATPKNGFWCLCLKAGEYLDVVRKKLNLKLRPEKIRVRLDYDEGKVSFYNTDDMSLICSHTDRFKEKIFPFFSVGKAGDAKTKEIKICPSDVQIKT
uniref:Nuclear factor 7, brain n=1 Tax=Neogobius melanostomus TaxID=47308 RepID=A0A8C6T6T5_9GOBI